MAKVAIVGGGVIGCAVAERLARERHDVVLLERDHVGAHASGAAAGLLAPHSELPGDDLGSRSARLFQELVERIERVSGIEVEYRQGESLALAFEATERLRGGRWLEPAECLDLEPGLNPDLAGAALLAESQVTPPRFVQALARTATAQGAKVRTGAPVASFEVHGGRLGGIRLAGDRGWSATDRAGGRLPEPDPGHRPQPQWDLASPHHGRADRPGDGLSKPAPRNVHPPSNVGIGVIAKRSSALECAHRTRGPWGGRWPSPRQKLRTRSASIERRARSGGVMKLASKP